MGCARREYRSEGTKSSLAGHERTHGSAARNVRVGSHSDVLNPCAIRLFTGGFCCKTLTAMTSVQ